MVSGADDGPDATLPEDGPDIGDEASPADAGSAEAVPPDGAPAVPSPRTKHRSPLWTKVSIVLGVLLMVLSLGLLGGERYLNSRYTNALHRSDLLAPGARHDEPGANLVGPLNYLLIGSDARQSNPSMGARSDTIIIVHIPASLDRAYLISIPRDLRVEIPPLASVGFPGAQGKINSSFQDGGQGNGGVQLLSATLTRLTGITFDGAAVVDFTGFDQIVGDLGGVHMCIDEPVKSIHTGHVFDVGCQYLTAKQALDYLRQRETLPGGDFDRQRHQQQFLEAVFSSMVSSGTIGDPLKLDKIIREIGASMTVDLNGIPLDQLVYSFRHVQPSTVVGVRVPSFAKTLGGISYVLQEPAADGLYAAINEDDLGAWTDVNSQWVNAL